MKRLVFDGSADVLKYIQKNESSVRDFLSNNERFVNYKTYDDIVRGLKLGIKDYNKNFIKELKDIEDTNIETNDYFFTDNGLFYDMQSVVDGLPECMLTTQEDERKQLKIVADYSYPAHTSNETINNRGIALFKLFYTLITRNYNLEIEFVTRIEHSYRSKDKNMDLIFKLPKNEINIPTIAYYCNVEFFRAVSCAIMENEGFDPDCCHSISFVYDKNDFFVGGGYTDRETIRLTTVEKADEFITDRFNKYLSERGMK